MDPATAHRAQDVGPPLDSPDAAAFLAFWGEDIAEKTRFQVCAPQPRPPLVHFTVQVTSYV